MKDSEVVKIDTDINLFTEIESYFADTKLYLNSCKLQGKGHQPTQLTLNQKKKIKFNG